MATHRYVLVICPPCACANSRLLADGVVDVRHSSFAFKQCSVNQELDPASWFSTRVLQLQASPPAPPLEHIPFGISLLATRALDPGSSPPRSYPIFVLIVQIRILATLSHIYTLSAQVSSSSYPRSVHQTFLSLAADLRYSRSASRSIVGRSVDDDSSKMSSGFRTFA